MAKFVRHDPRNKKKDRNKQNSINKTHRIHRVEQTKLANIEKILKEIAHDDESTANFLRD